MKMDVGRPSSTHLSQRKLWGGDHESISAVKELLCSELRTHLKAILTKATGTLKCTAGVILELVYVDKVQQSMLQLLYDNIYRLGQKKEKGRNELDTFSMSCPLC
jgi:hypothetical protein